MANKKLKERFIFIIYNLIMVCAVLGLLEVGFTFLLNNPNYIPKNYLRAFKDYYNEFDRSTIQVDTLCACYDNELFYTLRKGECNFSNREFNNNFLINSIGIRGTEQDLVNPKAVFVGDSHCMGWGVDTDSTFSKLYESSTGIKTINCGISSYGTVRELKILNRINFEKINTLFIQYHPNDSMENKKYKLNGDTLIISSKDIYFESIKAVNSRTSYFFGKRSMYLLRKILMLTLRGERMVNRNYEEEVKMFLNVLCKSDLNLEGKKIVVFELNDNNQNDNYFVNFLDKEKQKEQYPKFIKNIITVRVSDLLNSNDYYILDSHINTNGHKKLADKFLEL